MSDLKGSDVVEHTIETGNHPPIRLRPYKASYFAQQAMDKQCKEMLENDIIELSTSPWCCPTIMVKKKTGDLRMVQDFENLMMLQV